jgi:hypothetical protein
MTRLWLWLTATAIAALFALLVYALWQQAHTPHWKHTCTQSHIALIPVVHMMPIGKVVVPQTTLTTVFICDQYDSTWVVPK